MSECRSEGVVPCRPCRALSLAVEERSKVTSRKGVEPTQSYCLVVPKGSGYSVHTNEAAFGTDSKLQPQLLQSFLAKIREVRNKNNKDIRIIASN